MEVLSISPDYMRCAMSAEPVRGSVAEDYNPLCAHAAFEPVEGQSGEPLYFLEKGSGVAVVRIVGPMSKGGGLLAWLFGGADTVEARTAITSAMSNPKVRGLFLVIDSPGGSVAGVQELSDALAAAGQKMPTAAHIDDLGASAAYWVASQAQRVTANRTALVGSIGVYVHVYDYSKAFENEGIKLVEIKTGKHKGGMAPGSEITDEDKAELQTRVDAVNAEFMNAVATGRRMSVDQVNELADGRTWTGAEAREKGLIDEVMNFDQSLSVFSAKLERGKTRRRQYGAAATLGLL